MKATDWDQRWRERTLHAHVRGEPSAAVVGALAGADPGKALDLACGPGRHAVWLAEQGWSVTAVDFSEEALRQARARAAESGVEVEWVCADIVDYEPRGVFDLVLVAFVHVPADSRRALLARAAGAVAPGGAFVLVGHDLANLGTGAPGPADPTRLYTPDDIVAELPDLTIETAERIRRSVELEDGGTAEAVDALVCARRPRA